MSDYRELEVWNDARRLALAAFELTKSSGRGNLSKLTAEIQGACVEMLSSIQRLETGTSGDSCSTAEQTVSKLSLLFAEARQQGLIGTFELSLVLREVTAVKESLKEISQMSVMPGSSATTRPIARML